MTCFISSIKKEACLDIGCLCSIAIKNTFHLLYRTSLFLRASKTIDQRNGCGWNALCTSHARSKVTKHAVASKTIYFFPIFSAKGSKCDEIYLLVYIFRNKFQLEFYILKWRIILLDL